MRVLLMLMGFFHTRSECSHRPPPVVSDAPDVAAVVSRNLSLMRRSESLARQAAHDASGRQMQVVSGLLAMMKDDK